MSFLFVLFCFKGVPPGRLTHSQEAQISRVAEQQMLGLMGKEEKLRGKRRSLQVGREGTGLRGQSGKRCGEWLYSKCIAWNSRGICALCWKSWVSISMLLFFFISEAGYTHPVCAHMCLYVVHVCRSEVNLGWLFKPFKKIIYLCVCVSARWG